MDILHHTTIGITGAIASTSIDQPALGAAFMIASIVPDFDAITGLFNKIKFLETHQGFTHSILFIFLYSILIPIICLPFHLNTTDYTQLFLGSIIGISLHIILDMFNTLGPMLKWPSKKRIQLDSCYFIDLTSWSITILFLILILIFNHQFLFPLYIISLLTILTLRCYMNILIKRKTQYQISIPDPIIPWKFKFTKINQDNQAETADYNLFNQKITNHQILPKPNPLQLKLLKKSKIYKKMKNFQRMPFILPKSTNNKIVIRDIALRYFKPEYGEITLEIDKNNIINEHINI